MDTTTSRASAIHHERWRMPTRANGASVGLMITNTEGQW